jgi:F-type H+-transporting ATPase subunit b
VDQAHETLEHGHEQSEEHITNPIENVFGLHYGKDNHGGTYEKGEHPMPPPFGLSLLNFLAFYWLIFRFAGPGIKKATRERHQEIAKALAEGTRLRDEARAKLAEYDQKLAGLQGEIDTLVGAIRSEAEAEKTRIIGEAEARAARMQKDAEQQIQAEIQRVRTTLEREAVEAAVAIAEKLLREKTNDADQRVLADRFLKGLQDAAGKRRSI